MFQSYKPRFLCELATLAEELYPSSRMNKWNIWEERKDLNKFLGAIIRMVYIISSLERLFTLVFSCPFRINRLTSIRNPIILFGGIRGGRRS